MPDRPTPADMPGAPPRPVNSTVAGPDHEAFVPLTELEPELEPWSAVKAYRESLTRPIPQPPPVQPPRPLTREQYIRRGCLELAVKYFSGLAESDEDDLFAAARSWAEWIRTGQHDPAQD